MPRPIPVTLIPGDGIGSEIVEATLAALDALGAPFEWDRQIAGLEAVRVAKDPLPAATLDSIRRTRLALKGPLETPSGGGYRSSNVRLREEFKLYANLRPARTLVPGGRFDHVDLIVVRENLEGLYIGHELYVQIDDAFLRMWFRVVAPNRGSTGQKLVFTDIGGAGSTAVQSNSNDRAQGQHHEGAHGHLPRDGTAAVRR